MGHCAWLSSFFRAPNKSLGLVIYRSWKPLLVAGNTGAMSLSVCRPAGCISYECLRPACRPDLIAPQSSQTQVIIIPGALISPFAYSIMARSLAQRGYPSFVVRLPFDLGAKSDSYPQHCSLFARSPQAFFFVHAVLGLLYARPHC